MLYKVAGPAEPKPASDEEKGHFAPAPPPSDALQKALWAYAATHDGRFPAQADPAVEARYGKRPAAAECSTSYVSGKKADKATDPVEPLAYEPELYGPNASC